MNAADSTPDEADVEFDEGTHTYSVRGRTLVSVSALISPLFDFDGIPERVPNRKRDIGVALHLACELDDVGALDEESVAPEIAGYLKGWRTWRAQSAPKWDGIEEIRHDIPAGFAGRPDRWGLIGGRRALVDIKTVASVHPGYGVQLAAYSRLAYGSDVAPSVDRILVQLRPDGTFRERRFTHPDDFRCLAALLAVHHWKEKYAC